MIKKTILLITITLSLNAEYLVNKWAIKLYNTANESSEIVGYKDFGDPVNVLESKVNWKKIEFQNADNKRTSTAYVKSNDITKTIPGTVKVITYGNLRSMPSLLNKYKVGHVRKGQKFTTKGRVGDWYILNNKRMVYKGLVKFMPFMASDNNNLELLISKSKEIGFKKDYHIEEKAYDLEKEDERLKKHIYTHNNDDENKIKILEKKIKNIEKSLEDDKEYHKFIILLNDRVLPYIYKKLEKLEKNQENK